MKKYFFSNVTYSKHNQNVPSIFKCREVTGHNELISNNRHSNKSSTRSALSHYTVNEGKLHGAYVGVRKKRFYIQSWGIDQSRAR